MKDKEKNGLLERFREAAGCAFLSDLSVAARPQSMFILMEMLRLGVGEYSLSEWNDAVSYITGSPHSFQSVQEASDFLIQYLT